MIPRLPGVGSELYGPFRCVSYAMGVPDGGKRGTGSRSPDAMPHHSLLCLLGIVS